MTWICFFFFFYIYTHTEIEIERGRGIEICADGYIYIILDACIYIYMHELFPVMLALPSLWSAVIVSITTSDIPSSVLRSLWGRRLRLLRGLCDLVIG